MPDGTQERFSHDWGDQIQTTDGKFGASFYLGRDGFSSFSGGLNPSIKKEHLIKTDKLEEARFWFFHHDYATAHNGVHVEVLVPVYEYRPEIKQAKHLAAGVKQSQGISI